MADPLTGNTGLIQMATGTASGAWGAVLNASMIGIVDQVFGNNVNIALSNSNVSLSTTQRQNLAYTFTGTLSAPVSVSFPLGFNSTTQAVGGVFIIDNNTTGGFAITVNTVVTGSVGVVVPQGVRSVVTCDDGINIRFADDAQNQLVAFNGNPNGNVAGFAASASTRASKVLDRSTNEEYLCATGTGAAAGAIWYKNMPYSVPAQGYLTANNNPTNPVLTSDSIGASTIYYTGFRGNQIWVYNGFSYVPVTIPGGQLSLVLSNSSQGSNGIYDAMGFIDPNGTALVVAFSPGWSTVTAGSGARGSGAGSPQLARVNGLLVNAVSQTANNGATSYQIGTSKGTYLGSVYVDATAGQVTCHISYGQSRKWGIWNAYNREPIYVKAGDPTVNWNVPSNSGFRPSNNNSANSITPFTGLPEETVFGDFITAFIGNPCSCGIGVNSTSTPTGTYLYGDALVRDAFAKNNIVPGIGTNNVYALEGRSSSATGQGTEAVMLLSVRYSG